MSRNCTSTIYASNLIQSELHLGVACDENTPLIEFFLLKSSSCMFVQETRNEQENPSVVASIALLMFYLMSSLFIYLCADDLK